mmetsp:Transcript_19766/g.58641  ORF Transcript_19766/g.58641 Transcript_19766/m.58641 type:complete len:283 (+) Transcript_19766:2227-3075(+)
MRARSAGSVGRCACVSSNAAPPARHSTARVSPTPATASSSPRSSVTVAQQPEPDVAACLVTASSRIRKASVSDADRSPLPSSNADARHITGAMLRAQKRATSGPPWPSKHAKRLTRPACSAPPSPTPSTSPAVSADRSASTPGAPTLGVSTPGAPRLGMLCAGSSAPGLLDSCVPPRCRACAPLRPSMLHSASTARSTVCAPSITSRQPCDHATPTHTSAQRVIDVLIWYRPALELPAMKVATSWMGSCASDSSASSKVGHGDDGTAVSGVTGGSGVSTTPP